MVLIVEIEEDSENHHIDMPAAASSSVPPATDTDHHRSLESSAAADIAQDSVSQHNDRLQIIDAVPLRIINRQLKEEGGKELHSLRQRNWIASWMDVREEGKYEGIFDKFYYESGTKRQIMSIKEVEKHMDSRRQTLNPKTPNPAGASDKQTKKRNIEETNNKLFQFGFENSPKKVTWVLTDAQTNDWKAFMRHENVPDDIQ